MILDELAYFKTYDIRAEIGENFNADTYEVIGIAFASLIGAKKVV